MEREWVYVQLDIIGNNGTGMGVCTTGHDRKQMEQEWKYVQLDKNGTCLGASMG